MGELSRRQCSLQPDLLVTCLDEGPERSWAGGRLSERDFWGEALIGASIRVLSAVPSQSEVGGEAVPQGGEHLEELALHLRKAAWTEGKNDTV